MGLHKDVTDYNLFIRKEIYQKTSSQKLNSNIHYESN